MIASARREYFVNRVMRPPPAPLIANSLLGSARKTRGAPATNGQNRGHSPAGEVAERGHIGRLAVHKPSWRSSRSCDPGREWRGKLIYQLLVSGRCGSGAAVPFTVLNCPLWS